MNPRFRMALFAYLILLSEVGLSLAQAPVEPAKDDQGAKKPDVPKGESKDPTSPSPKLKELLYAEKSGKLAGKGPGPMMPALGLRGRVIAANQPPLALLELGGKVFVVAKGNSLPSGNNTVLRIIEINSREVRIEVLPFKEIIILR